MRDPQLVFAGIVGQLQARCVSIAASLAIRGNNNGGRKYSRTVVSRSCASRHFTGSIRVDVYSCVTLYIISSDRAPEVCHYAHKP